MPEKKEELREEELEQIAGGAVFFDEGDKRHSSTCIQFGICDDEKSGGAAFKIN